MEINMESKPQIPNPNETPTPQSQHGPEPGAGGIHKPYDLRERTLEFGVRILNVATAILKEGASRSVSDQLSRSGTSVGANVEEADGAATRADKRKTFVVARKEARETRYWLRLIDRVWGQKVPVRNDIQEAQEIVNILSTIIDRLA
jgi:four helix bundle protein